MVTTEHLTFERDGATAIVTMNRPEAKNALSLPMLVGMKDAWEEIDGNDDIRCAILTGAGGTFCAGMDLKAMGGSDAEKYQSRMAEDPDLHWKALLRHYDLRKPLIAAVEGWAVAGGTEILQATHIRVAGEGAIFGVFEAKRGLFPLGGSTVRLRRQIPYTMANSDCRRRIAEKLTCTSFSEKTPYRQSIETAELTRARSLAVRTTQEQRLAL